MNEQQPQGLTKTIVNPTDAVMDLTITEADGTALANSLHVEVDGSAPTPTDLSIVVNPALLRTHHDEITLSVHTNKKLNLSIYMLIHPTLVADDDAYKKAPMRKLTVAVNKFNQPIVISKHNGFISFEGVALERIDVESEKQKVEELSSAVDESIPYVISEDMELMQ